MARSTRRRLLDLAESSLAACDAMDQNLYLMNEAAGGRQPALGQMNVAIINATEMSRILWMELKSRL
jgi:hypothetical protein